MAKKQFKPAVSDAAVEKFVNSGAQVIKEKAVKSVGRPIVRTEATKKFNCELPEVLFKQLKIDAVENDTTMTNIIIDLLKKRYN